MARRSTLALLSGLDAEAWGRRGVANGAELTVRGQAWIIARHTQHRVEIQRGRDPGA